MPSAGLVKSKRESDASVISRIGSPLRSSPSGVFPLTNHSLAFAARM